MASAATSTVEAAPKTDRPGTQDPAALLDVNGFPFGQFKSWVGPRAHLKAERQRLAQVKYDHIEAVPQGATLGAEIRGVNLAAVLSNDDDNSAGNAAIINNDISNDIVGEIRQALADFKVIFFRNQPITSAQHVNFAKKFGDLEIHPFITGNTDHPELVRFEKGADTGGFENAWHHDVTWREVPSGAAILRAVQVPQTGGDTLFCDMAAAYDGLTDDIKSRVDGLHAIHDFMMAFGHTVAPDDLDDYRKRYPQVKHPVICTHPTTGRKLIFVNRFFVSHIEGIDAAESFELIMHLTAQADVVEYQYRLRWEPDTLVIWDNRAVQHYAASDYLPDVRIMERASVVGTRPAA